MNILAVGYFGEGNAGDDMLLARLNELVAINLPEATLTASWGSKSPWPCPVEDRTSRSLDDVVGRIDRVNAVILGPGGLLHNASLANNRHRDRGLAYLDAVVSAALATHTPVAAVAVGLGPIQGSTARSMTKRILDSCVSVSTRDERSTRLARSMRSGETVQVQDLVLGWQPDTDVSSSSRSRTLGVSLRPWGDRSSTAKRTTAIADAIRRLTCEGAVDGVVGIPLSVHRDEALDDRGALAMLKRELAPSTMEILQPTSLEDIQRAIRGVDLMLGMRLHAIIVAANAGVRTVGIAYDQKVDSVAASIDIRTIATDADASRIYSACLQALAADPASPTSFEHLEIGAQLTSLASARPTTQQGVSSARRFVESLFLAKGM
ncbi:MAG: polysaccharide pyruvyl transferase CsaB [Acidimicrobiia bacterium]|nr:MAG: polysaccharide pyruvyl transferase CsaB [Acidimicrobiia bacterium]